MLTQPERKSDQAIGGVPRSAAAYGLGRRGLQANKSIETRRASNRSSCRPSPRPNPPKRRIKTLDPPLQTADAELLRTRGDSKHVAPFYGGGRVFKWASRYVHCRTR